ncbi:methanol oxidation system protein MoxJ [Bosea sp. 117]|uniref:methanol oxidation system protein MoxJ n=1 Tax=Bosea sp. 117 TaxID=1125973 RepID=UPI000493CF6E|nr:methanol oxidation system protein MoxJ [Bosea sp. 117]
MSKRQAVSHIVLLAAGLAAAALAGAARGEAAGVPEKSANAELRICASNAEAPFSEKDSSGFEDRVAMALAEAMGRKPVFVRTEQPGIYLVRDQLDKNTCDVVMGVDAGDERMLTSRPYYRTGYVLVSRAERNITAENWDDQQVRDQTRFAVRFYSPAETMLKRIGRFEDNAAYMYSLVNFKSRRNQWVQVPGDRIVSEVAGGEADIGIAFAPEVARYVKSSSTPLRMTVIRNDLDRPDAPPIPMHYDQAVGVRKGDDALLADINVGLEKARPKIEKILSEEGIPLLKPNS